jgi:hypothetical protein
MEKKMIDIGDGLTFEIDWREEGWDPETWVVVNRNPDPRRHIISKDSPLGRALTIGEEIFESPEGQKHFRIIEVRDSAGNRLSIATLKKKAPAFRSFVTLNNPVALRIAGLMRKSQSDYFRDKISIPLPKLDDRDILLSLKWHGASESISREQLIAGHEEYRGLARMLSARAAEKAVIHFFERMLTGELKDISISQLDDEACQGNWRKYDILADKVPYDVKNSRQARLSDSNYVEHCVPRFKEERDQNVKIIGTLSPYLRVNQLLDHENISFLSQKPIRVLGCVARPILDNLIRHFTRDTFQLKFTHHCRDGTFLPPWIFDYPSSYYSKRDEGLCQLVEVTQEDWAQSSYSPVPVYLALGLEPPIEWQRKMNYTWQVDFFQRILAANSEFGLSLPAVFLTILTHFLDTVANDETTKDFNPSEYRKLLFSNGSLSSPLFLHDPLKTVDSLIATLTTLWEAPSNQIQEYSSFRLVSAGILRGRLASHPNVEHGLVAYCGGRTKENWPCGNIPLVLGEHEHCECGMLICDECGFCSSRCKHNAVRQAEFKAP